MKKLVAVIVLASSAFSVTALAQDGEIAAVQKRLVELGFTPGNTTGEWGPRTRNAVAFFQRRNGVSNANGYITDETLILLGLKNPAPEAATEANPVPAAVPAYIAEIATAPVYTPEPAAPEPVFEAAAPAPVAPPVVAEPAPSYTQPALSTTQYKLVTPVIRFGAVFGGDNTFAGTAAGATPTVDDPEIDFGGMIDAAVGVNVRLGKTSAVSVQLTAGYRVQEEDRDDGKARVSTAPINLTMFYNYEKFRFGIGAVAHLDPNQFFEVQGQGVLIDRTLDDAIGGVLEATYKPMDDSSFMVGLRYEGIDYEVPGQTAPADASTLGAFVGFGF